MPDSLPDLFKRAAEACPCRNGYSGLCGENKIGCRCRPDARPGTLGWLPCFWPGHAALREIAERLHDLSVMDDGLPGRHEDVEPCYAECLALRRACLLALGEKV